MTAGLRKVIGQRIGGRGWGGGCHCLTSALFGKLGLRAETHHVVFVQYKEQESSVMRMEEGVISGLSGAACADGLYAI